MNDILLKLEIDGYAVLPNAIGAGDLQAIEMPLAELALTGAGSRNLLEYAWCRRLAVQLARTPAIREALPSAAMAIQCTLFDKHAASNWLVALHQDLSVPVLERREHPELRGWSRKEGVDFVQPPKELLETLLIVRVHLDACDLDSGPIRIVPGSHRCGRLSGTEARQLRESHGERACVADPGDALLMRPLVLHASSKATKAAHRRVLHFVYGPHSPGYGLDWRSAVQLANPPDRQRRAAPAVAGM